VQLRLFASVSFLRIRGEFASFRTFSLGIFDKAYAKATAGSTDEHTYIAPDLFTAETPLGTYQGMTDQIVMSRTPGAFRTVLAARGSSKPEWLSLRK
jgi:hypothetical protein